MLENACAKKRRLNPARGQRRNFRKLNGRDRRTDQRHMSSSDRSCRTRSSSPRSCARHDSRPCGRADAIAVKHSAQAPREMPRKRKSRQMRARDLLNARTCSSRSDLVSPLPLAQEISAKRTNSRSEFIANSLQTGQARRHYQDKTLSLVSSRPPFVSKTKDLNPSRSTHALLDHSCRRRDRIRSYDRPSVTARGARQRAANSPWN